MMISSTSWKDDPLEFLVRCRFPLAQRHVAAFLGLSAQPTNMPASVKEAADYRRELLRLTRSELLERAAAAANAEAERADRYFNQSSADIDVEHWARMSLWTLDEAVALSLGKDPRRVNWDNVRSFVGISPFSARYQSRAEIINRAKLAGQLWDSTIPAVFIAWAERMNVDLPLPLVDAVKGLGIQVADWKSAHDAQKRLADDARAELFAEKEAAIEKTKEHMAYLEKMGSRYGEIINGYKARIEALESAARRVASLVAVQQKSNVPTADKPLGAKERESLLKLVIGMAVAAYRYNPAASRSEVVSEIASDLEKAGVALDVDTVRKYLREGRELLPPSEAEQKR